MLLAIWTNSKEGVGSNIFYSVAPRFGNILSINVSVTLQVS